MSSAFSFLTLLTFSSLSSLHHPYPLSSTILSLNTQQAVAPAMYVRLVTTKVRAYLLFFFLERFLRHLRTIYFYLPSLSSSISSLASFLHPTTFLLLPFYFIPLACDLPLPSVYKPLLLHLFSHHPLFLSFVISSLLPSLFSTLTPSASLSLSRTFTDHSYSFLTTSSLLSPLLLFSHHSYRCPTLKQSSS